MVQAEQSVIGCLMMAPELLDKARAVLSPAMFEAQPLARIFSCIRKLAFRPIQLRKHRLVLRQAHVQTVGAVVGGALIVDGNRCTR